MAGTADERAVQLAIELRGLPGGRELARNLYALIGSGDTGALAAASARAELAIEGKAHFTERLHPRDRHGRWAHSASGGARDALPGAGAWSPKAGDRAHYFHTTLGRNVPVTVRSPPDKRGYMRVQMPKDDQFRGEVRRVPAGMVSEKPADVNALPGLRSPAEPNRPQQDTIDRLAERHGRVQIDAGYADGSTRVTTDDGHEFVIGASGHVLKEGHNFSVNWNQLPSTRKT